MSSSPQPQQFMYVIAHQSSGPVKIGISADPAERVKDLQTGHPDALFVFHSELIDTARVRLYERLIHRDNHHHRLKGEWFDMTVEQAIGYVLFTQIEYDLVPIDVLQNQLSSRRTPFYYSLQDNNEDTINLL